MKTFGEKYSQFGMETAVKSSRDSFQSLDVKEFNAISYELTEFLKMSGRY